MVVTSNHVLALSAMTALALLAGAAAMQHLDHRLPHAHVERVENSRRQPQLGLVVTAISLHNLPEGLAVGVAAASGALYFCFKMIINNN